MPAIVDLVAAISDAVVARLAAASYPSLVDGAILLGRQHIYESSAAPRIVFVPMGSEFAPKDPASPDITANAARLQRQQRSIRTDLVTFEVHCWGHDTSAPVDCDVDFDVTQALYQCIIQALQSLCSGCFQLGPGKWTGSVAGATQLARAGQEFVFTVKVATPVLDVLLPYAQGHVTIGITNATDVAGVPIIITTGTPHGLYTGNAIVISGVLGQTLANGTWTITRTGDTTFRIPVNGDGSHTYTGGGTIASAGVLGTTTVTLTDSAGHTADQVIVRES